MCSISSSLCFFFSSFSAPSATSDIFIGSKTCIWACKRWLIARRTLLSEIIRANISVACVVSINIVEITWWMRAHMCKQLNMAVCVVCVCRSWFEIACIWWNFYSPGKLISQKRREESLFFRSFVAAAAAVAFENANDAQAHMCGKHDIMYYKMHNTACNYARRRYINAYWVCSVCTSVVPFYHILRVYACNLTKSNNSVAVATSFNRTLFEFSCKKITMESLWKQSSISFNT